MTAFHTINQRSASPIDIVSEKFLEKISQNDPIIATSLGITGYDHLLPDYSPDSLEALIDLIDDTEKELNSLTDTDIIDSASRDVLREQLSHYHALYNAGLSLGELNVITSPIHNILNSFDLLDLKTSEGVENALCRLEAIPIALRGYSQSLELRADKDVFPLRTLQVQLAIDDIKRHPDILASIKYRSPYFEHTIDRFDTAIEHARQAYNSLEQVCTQLLPKTITENAVGIDAYRIFSRTFLGETIDFEQIYHWGQEFLATIITEQQNIAEQIIPGGSIDEAFTALNNDPQYMIEGTDALQRWMQETSDAAISELSSKYFDIPPELVDLQCCIAPSSSGAIYYTSPSEDFSRAGKMWWSVPEGEHIFHTWQERTTVYHEGVPGHHLQLGTAILSTQLNRFRKLASFISGHGEGWALYSELLMDELGFLPTLGDRLGMLNAQRLRATRVILDIGYHCQFPAPHSVGGGSWDYEKAWTFLRSQVASSNPVVRFELHRYLGWPGQAPSYAIGQKIWRELRDDYLKYFPGSTKKDFHQKALALGGIGLSDLRKYVLS